MIRYFVSLVFIASSINASDARDLIIEKLLKEVEELKQSVAELKREQTSTKDMILLKESVSQIKSEQKKIQLRQDENEQFSEEIMEFAESTETRTLEDKLKFGVGFKTSFDHFSKKYTNNSNSVDSDIWTNKLMFNVKANIADDMKFYSRLSMYKSWGDSTTHTYSYYDNMQGRVPSDSSLYIERAYIDWSFNENGYIPMALTIGRQPSGDGPSQHFKDNLTRKATYSSLLYDGAADGIIATFDVSKLLNNNKTYLRVGYAKGYGYSESQNVGNAFVGASNSDILDTDVYGLFLDTTIPGINDSLIQISYSKINNIVANPLDTNSSTNKNIGDIDMYGAMVELTDIKDIGLDLFLHYGYISSNPSSEIYTTSDGVNYGGLLSSSNDISSKNGSSVWLGGRYGFGEKEKYKIGLEYNHGSKNWVSLTQGSFDVYNKLSTRGDAYEAYLMYVINRYANIRLGIVDIDYDYSRSGWFLGEAEEIDKTTSDELKSLQSIYIKMNVKY